MKDYKIGEQFEFGGDTLEVVFSKHGGSDCYRCAFDDNAAACKASKCCIPEREDGEEVHFEKVEL